MRATFVRLDPEGRAHRTCKTGVHPASVSLLHQRTYYSSYRTTLYIAYEDSLNKKLRSCRNSCFEFFLILFLTFDVQLTLPQCGEEFRSSDFRVQLRAWTTFSSFTTALRASDHQLRGIVSAAQRQGAVLTQ